MHYPCNNALSLCTGCALFASFPPQIHSPTSLTLVGFSLVLWLPDGLAKGRPQQEIPKGRRVDISSCSLPASALGASSFQVTPPLQPPILSSSPSASSSGLSSSTQANHLILILPECNTESPTFQKSPGPGQTRWSAPPALGWQWLPRAASLRPLHLVFVPSTIPLPL